MGQDIIPFVFNGNQVRTITRDGDPWFVAKDVCDCLGLTVKNSARYLDADEKSKASRKRLGVKRPGQAMVIVDESGLYALILKSRKPAARAFRKWVTKEVLPTIRKTGAYISDDITIDQYRALKRRFAQLERIFAPQDPFGTPSDINGRPRVTPVHGYYRSESKPTILTEVLQLELSFDRNQKPA